MVISSLKKLVLISSLFAAGVLISCQKEVDIDLDNPPPVPDEIKDSTLLIKSISLVIEDDSVVEHYFYDSINRKVILTWDDPSGEFFEGSSAELNYNDKGLLSHISYNYSNGYTPDHEDKSAIDLVYGEDKILEKIAVKLYGGKSETTLFYKTMLAAGKYQLDWIEPLFYFSSNDSANVQAVFDADGKCVSSSLTYSQVKLSDGNGNPISYTQIRDTDSLIYDANGSIIKIINNHVDTFDHSNETIIREEYISRESRGNQLYHQHQALLNGIANIPFLADESGKLKAFAGLLSDLPGESDIQYSKFPFQTARVYNWQTRQYDSFTSVSEFDSKDRLVKFKGFFDDSELIPLEYKITYYK